LETDPTNNVAQAPQTVTVTGHVDAIIDNGGAGFSQTVLTRREEPAAGRPARA
jgi:hypothetical protein